ncbi:hypothetical protein [Novosphingobium huizhouense]|uniref:hypothetical protein n=1 Tax=Novosphingobium huizhouense TaxID=2866625 RepID=UPI001CD8719F|nr:hypothetical protein [Novosphingobium huizhouense]
MSLLAGGALCGALAAIAFVPTESATSADHLDPPTRTDGGFDTTPDVPADIADVFAWHSDGTVKIAMTFAGPVRKSEPLHYDRDVLYKIHISTKKPGTTDEFTIRARFGKGAGDKDWGVRFEGVPGVAGAIEGPAETTLQKDGVKARAGLFDEPFFFDLIGFRETRQLGQIRIRNNRNFFDEQNDMALVFEIPDANFGADVSQLELWGQTLRFGGNL